MVDFNPGKDFPNLLYIEIATKCNMNCNYCPSQSRTGKLLSFEKFKEIIDRFDDYPIKTVNLIGLGEPLLNQDLQKIVDYVFDHNFYMTITTNGTIFNEKFYESLYPMLSEVYVSLDGVRPNGVHKRNRNINSENVMKTIEQIKKANPGLRIVLQPVVTKGFINEVMEYINYANTNNLKIHPTVPVVWNRELFERFYPPDNEIVSIMSMLKEANKTDEHLSLYPRWRICRDPFSLFMVVMNGDVYPCCFINTIRNNEKEYFYGKTVEIDLKQYCLGNIYKDDIKKITNSPKLKKIRQNILYTKPEDWYRRNNIDCSRDATNYCKICLARWQKGC